VSNTATMQAAIALADHLVPDTILRLHAALMGDQPAIAGQWRTKQVWIGAGEGGPRIADFVPPDYTRVPSLIEDVSTFMRRTDMPVLVQAAIAQAQFETIHPFADDNGRTGRALIHTLLRNKALTAGSTVPISAGLLTDTNSYFSALTAYRNGDLDPIVSMVSSASIRAVANARRLIADLHEVRATWDAKIRARRGADAWHLADLLLRRPVVTVESVATDLGVLPNNVHRLIGPLEDAEILVASAGSRRGTKVWRSPEILDAFDAFAERAGRRNWG
jgi:Fic family protein